MSNIFYMNGMVSHYAKDAGMLIPDNPENFDFEKYPHFSVYTQLVTGTALDYEQFVKIAQVIADVPYNRIKKVTYEDLIEMGCDFTTYTDPV